MTPDEKRPYAPVRYGPKSPEWAREMDRVKAGQERRDKKFIEAIMAESRQKGKPMSWDQAKRELQKQQRLSQKETLWLDHRETLVETSPKGEAREQPSKYKVTKAISRPPESEVDRLKRENAELKQMIESLKESVEVLTAQNRQMKREMSK